MTPQSLPTEIAARLPTPCLLVDLPAADRNIARAAERFMVGPVRLRPHFKAHKTTRLLRRQVEAGGCVGVTCQTADEAEILVHEGFDEILVANQVVDPLALTQLAAAARLARVTVAVDDLRHVALLESICQLHDCRLGVVIELDVGIGRCGLPAGSPHLVPLARSIGDADRLTFRGVQAYEGHVVMREDESMRRTMLAQIYAVVRAEIARLAEAGFSCELISGAGTGTLDLAAELAVVNEVQAGSYVLMDAKYASLGLTFEPALYLATRVISRRDPRAAVVNSGLKEATVEFGNPKPIDPRLAVIALSDEHTRLSVSGDGGPEVGELVLFLPAHIDPTINLHDALFVWDGGAGLERWPVDGRRDSTRASWTPEMASAGVQA